MDASTILSLIQAANNAAATLAQLIPEIEANYAQAKAALSETDTTKLQEQIGQLHADTSALTAQLDALRDPTP